MADTNTQAEPTMEEILASIRRIISEDTDQPSDEKAPPEADEPEEEEDGFDEADAMPEPEPQPEPEPELEPEMAVEEEPEFEPEPEPEPDMLGDEPLAAASEDILELTEIVDAAEEGEIVSPEAAHKASETFHQLSGLLVRRYPGSENTLEGLVRDMLRPMLKEWLDDNLPSLVEEMVAKEIARITGRKE